MEITSYTTRRDLTLVRAGHHVTAPRETTARRRPAPNQPSRAASSKRLSYSRRSCVRAHDANSPAPPLKRQPAQRWGISLSQGTTGRLGSRRDRRSVRRPHLRPSDNRRGRRRPRRSADDRPSSEALGSIPQSAEGEASRRQIKADETRVWNESTRVVPADESGRRQRRNRSVAQARSLVATPLHSHEAAVRQPRVRLPKVVRGDTEPQRP
jgi:hypothetical protein